MLRTYKQTDINVIYVFVFNVLFIFSDEHCQYILLTKEKFLHVHLFNKNFQQDLLCTNAQIVTSEAMNVIVAVEFLTSDF